MDLEETGGEGVCTGFDCFQDGGQAMEVCDVAENVQQENYWKVRLR
jgi:hypothetical protein